MIKTFPFDYLRIFNTGTQKKKVNEEKIIMPEQSNFLKKENEGLPWWSSGKNPPSNAGDSGLIPGQRTKIAHAAGQLSPRATNYRAHVPWSPGVLEPPRHHYRDHVPWSPAPQLEKRKPAGHN